MPVERDELSASELEQLAIASHLIGDDGGSDAAWHAAYDRHLNAGNDSEAARCAFWLALGSLLQGRVAHASGWLGRAQSAASGARGCAASGLLLIPQMIGALESGDVGAGAALAERARAIGQSNGDHDLIAMATLGEGQARLAGGATVDGLERLDEVMLSVEAGTVGPIASGIIYCAVILECMQVFDLVRATEWTHALDAWCRAQDGLVPYRGQCLIHQSQIHQAAGEWGEALATAELASQRLSEPAHPALGLAHYQQAELLRVQGSFDEAADAYERARQEGHEPAPGFALLLLAQGDHEGARTNIRRLLAETTSASQRIALLSAAVEVMCAAGEIDAAAEAATELEQIADESSIAMVRAMSATATGSVHLARGDASSALPELRNAAAAWRQLSMPYEIARTRVRVGAACAALHDDTTASLEFEAARSTFADLGAQADLAAVHALTEKRTTKVASGETPLSARELEVLTLVAAGKTGPEIAGDLNISHHTVRRHLDNTFIKLGVGSRAAAVAYAYEHGFL